MLIDGGGSVFLEAHCEGFFFFLQSLSKYTKNMYKTLKLYIQTGVTNLSSPLPTSCCIAVCSYQALDVAFFVLCGIAPTSPVFIVFFGGCPPPLFQSSLHPVYVYRDLCAVYKPFYSEVLGTIRAVSFLSVYKDVLYHLF